MNGDQCSAKNPASTIGTGTLELVPENGLAWAIYPVLGIPLGEIPVSFNITATRAEISGPELYIGLANFTKGGWEWRVAGLRGSFIPLADGADYLSTLHTGYIAIVYTGAATAAVERLSFNTLDLGLAPPDNLAGVASVGQVALTWDAADGASGYLVERDSNKNFSTKTLLTSTPVAEPAYVDTTPLANRVYYYRVVTVAHSAQSLPGPYIDIHVPKVELAMPKNLRLDSHTVDSVRVRWEWAGQNPLHFEILLSSDPDEQLGERYAYAPGFIRSLIIDELDIPTTLYVRVVALDATDWRGPATDDLKVTTLIPWTWTSPVEVAAGEGPIGVCSTPTGIAAGYVGASGLNVAVFDGAAWSDEIAYPNAVSAYAGIACTAGGIICAVAHQLHSDDLVGAVGTPGDWTSARIHGDGNNGMGHGVSGEMCGVVGGDDEFIAWHFDSSASIWRVHKSPADNPIWSNEATLAYDQTTWVNFTYNGAAPYCTMFTGDKLQLADRAGGWVYSPVLDASQDGLGYGTRVLWDGSQWTGFAVFGLEQELYALHGAAAPWSTEDVDSTLKLGINSTNSVLLDGQPVICTFNPTQGWYFIEHRDSTWQPQPVGVAALNGSGNAGMAVVNGTPYIVFADPSDGKIKACSGIPPA